MAIYFYYGKEDFLISEEIEKLKKELLDEAFKAMNYRVYYSPEFPELMDICSSAPLMFGNLLSVVHCENYFMRIKNKKIEFTDEQLKSLETALKNAADGNNIVFVCNEPRDDDKKKTDTRLKIFKILTQNSNLKNFPEFKNYDKELPSVINRLLKAKDMTADTKTVRAIIEQCGVNLRIIDSELEKLKILNYPNKKITEKDVRANCKLQEDVFALADLIIGADKNAVLKNFRAATEKKHYLEILSLLQGNLHKLIYIKTCGNEKSGFEIMKALNMRGSSDYPIVLIKEKIRNKSLNDLWEFKHALTEAELKIKTGKTTNPEYLLESVLLTEGKNV